MLTITISASRFFDENTEEFVTYPPTTLKLEHSLISLQRWESKWHKSFLSTKEMTWQEQLDYIRCMSLDQNVDAKVFERLTRKDYERIRAYIHDSMTATTFSKKDKKTHKSIVTAEIIYYWMVSNGIPFECSKWHLNQLLTLIEVCSIKNNPKKMNKRDAARERAMMNEARRKRLGTKG